MTIQYLLIVSTSEYEREISINQSISVINEKPFVAIFRFLSFSTKCFKSYMTKKHCRL